MAPTEEDSFEKILSSLENMVPDLDSISNEVNRITESIDKHFKAVASTLLEYPVAASIRETIQKGSPWHYEPPQPTPQPPPRALTVGYIGIARRWVSNHRAVTVAVVAFIGTSVFVIWRQRRANRMKRRAKRAKNGARTEVVILAGSPHSPLTKSLSLDLERRGFIVYIPVNGLSEEHVVRSEGRNDIRPLLLDIASETSTTSTIEQFTSYISTPQHPLLHAPAHNLRLSSLVLLPSLEPPRAPIIALRASTWSDALNANIIAPFAILRAFLPLLISHKAALIFLTPSIVAALRSADHAPESVIAASMEAYISTLRREISAKDLNIVHLKLGSFDLGTSPSIERQMVATANIVRAENRGWDAATRAKHLKEQFSKLRTERSKGSPLRELHDTVFDSIVRGKARGGTAFVGRGAWTYDFVGRFPRSVVGWMMGLRQNKGSFVAGGSKPTEGSQEWERVEHA